jgi:isoquinoline 1-oxidoreductase alpha subunit
MESPCASLTGGRLHRGLEKWAEEPGNFPEHARGAQKMANYTINVNGKTHTVDVPGDMPLLWVLRDKINLKGTKFGCGVAACGACTVHLDGKVARACMTPIQSVGSQRVTTVEGIGETKTGQAVQKAWVDVDVVQCGYCQAGQVMAATALINSNPRPTDKDIDTAMQGNACRCGTYVRIREAIKTAAGVAKADTREV